MANTLTNIKDLTKDELRKLNALRKSVGDDIAEDAFMKWLESKKQDAGAGADRMPC